MQTRSSAPTFRLTPTLVRLTAAGLLGVGLIAAAAGCASRKSGLCADELAPEPLEGDAAASVAEGAEAWKNRGDEATLRKAIAAWERAVRQDPSNPATYVSLARGYYLLADGILRFEEERKEEMLQAFEQGTYYAELGLRRASPEFKTRVCAEESFDKAIEAVDAAGVGAMYWYATNLGKWALATGLIEALKNKDKIFAMMTRAKALDEGYFYAAPDRYFGAYYTKIPFPSGDPERSRKHFDASIKASPNYLATHVLLAELLATKTGDRALFEEQLKFVLDAAEDVLPDIVPEQRIEKRKAALLMEDIDVLFE